MKARALRQKYRVGQYCRFATASTPGWEQADGEICRIVAPKRPLGTLEWADLDGSNRNVKRNQVRYVVDWDGRELFVRESQLRAVDDEAINAVSTWEKFVDETGYDPHKVPAALSCFEDQQEAYGFTRPLLRIRAKPLQQRREEFCELIAEIGKFLRL